MLCRAVRRWLSFCTAPRLSGPRLLHPSCLLLQPFIYNSWEEPYTAGKEFYPIFWDAECPEHVPSPLAHLAAAVGDKAHPPSAAREL